MRFSKTLVKNEGVGITLLNLRRSTVLSKVFFSTSKLLSLGLILLVIGTSACLKSERVLDGERIAIIATNVNVSPDPAALAEGAGLPDLIANINAGHPGLTPGHTGGNIMADLPFKKVWSVSIDGAGNELTELAQPVVANGQVFTVTPNGIVTAFDIEYGTPNWQVVIETFDDDPLPGIAGGLAVSGDKLFVHAGG